MKNSEYWEQRVANETWRTYNSLEEKNRDLLKMYQEASLDLQEELYQVTQKINGGQGVSLSDMHKHNRLTNLQKNMEYRIRQLGEDVEKFGKDNMKSGIKDVYSNVIGSLDISNFSLPNEKLMEKMFNTPWQSDTFSNRLWKNTQKLATNLNDILTIGLTQGKTVTEMAINLNNQMNQGFNVSHRLIRTETMHYLNESAFKAYEDGGCTEVQLWAAEDERMCEVCGKKHGQKYTLKDRPTLPLHANCRCTYLPVVDMNKVEENNKVIQEQKERIKELEAKADSNESAGVNKSSVDKITTVDKAIKFLTENIGFTEVEDSFIQNVDNKLIVANTKQLGRLENKYGVIHKSRSTICSVPNNDSMAYIRNSSAFPTQQNLSLCPDSYKDFDKLAEEIREAIESGWVMPAKLIDEELSIRNVTHEYGHMLQNRLIQDVMESKGWTADKPYQFADFKTKNKKRTMKWYDDIISSTSKQHYEEIIEIAKENNATFKVTDSMSEYGMSNYNEFFAEAFANSELSEPNEIGKAIKVWLNRKGLGI